MATATVTPAAPAVAAPTATPAATSTPVSTPAATPATTPSPATGPLSHDASVSAMVEAAKAKGFGDDLSSTSAEPSQESELAKPLETPAKAEESTTTTSAATSQEEDEPGYSLEEDGFVGPKDLSAKIEANPALKAALDQNTRNEIMANARLAARTAEYEKHFASPAEAAIAVETAQSYANFSEAFNLVNQDIEKGTTAFINKLIEGSALRDDNGELMRDDKGIILTDGTASKFLTTVGKRWLALNVVRKVEALAANGDENVKAALDLVMESVGLLPSTAAKTTESDPALAARKAELDAQETRIRQERETSSKKSQQEYTAALKGDLQSLYESESAKLLDIATGLDEFTRSAVGSQIEAEFKEAIKSNGAYQTRKAQIRMQPFSPARRAKEVALAKQFTRDLLPRIARPILLKAGVVINGKVEAKAAAAAARAENARSEVSGGAASQPGAKTSGANLSPQQQYAEAEASWRAANPGREPKGSDITIHMMLQNPKLRNLAAA